MKIALIIATLVCLNAVQASEVDQFTNTESINELEDAADIVNSKANEILKENLLKLNKAGLGCNESEFYKSFRAEFGNHYKGNLGKFIYNDPIVPRLPVSIEESVFKNWSFTNGAILKVYLKKNTGEGLADIIRIGDVYLGADKFEHMFGRGLSYFTDYYLKNKEIDRTLKNGMREELFIYGGIRFETGVFSFGDLSANFNGMRFYNHLLLKNDDILGKKYNLGPYVKCENKNWVQVEEIDFRNYVDQTFNESKNCSLLASEKAIKKIKDNVSVEFGNFCRFSIEEKEYIQNKYSKFEKYLINKSGLEKFKSVGNILDTGSNGKN